MGKLIVHWSPLHGQARTTSSMGAVALAMNRVTGGRVCITNTQHDDKADLEGMFNSRMSEENKQLLYQAAGLNALISNIKRDKLTAEDVEGSTMPTPIKNVELLPGVRLEGSISAEDETDRLIYKILTEAVRDTYDWTFVDLAAGNVPLSKRLMKAADIVVVTLSQNRAMWDMFFDQYEEVAERENVFYLIGGHKSDSVYSAKNFSRMYQAYGTRLKTTGIVPDCVGYMDAISEGLVPSFFMMNRRAARKEENGEFIEECVNTATKLKTFADMLDGEPEGGRDNERGE